MSFDGSPSSSSRSTGSSDDFAALLDAELLDKQSSADDENVTAGGSQGGGEQQEEEEEEEEEEDGDEEEEEENEGEHEHEDGDRLDEILEGGSESSQGLGLGFDGVLTTEVEEDKAEDKEGLDTGAGSLQRLRDGSWSSHSHKRKHEENEMDYRKAGSRDGRQEEVGQDQMCPPHPGFMWGVCIRCGQQKSTTPTNDPVEAGVSLRYIHEACYLAFLLPDPPDVSHLTRFAPQEKTPSTSWLSKIPWIWCILPGAGGIRKRSSPDATR